MMVNLTISLFAITKLVPTDGMALGELETIDTEGNVLEMNTSLAYKVQHFSREDVVREYLNAGVQDTTQQYLQAGGDFLRGLFFFYEVFLKGSVMISPTLRLFKVPQNIAFFFDVPIAFLFVLALIQVLSGRSFEGMT